ncbi:MAG: alpha/beta hydrolase [Candidatus Paceibacterota bacterium]
MFLIITVSGIPVFAHAVTIWRSATNHSDEVLVYSLATPRWYEKDGELSKLLDTWSGSDFVTTASTSVHVWARWNGIYGSVLDIIFNASLGGNPFFGTGSTTAAIVMPINDYYYRLNVYASTSLEEYEVPTRRGVTIHNGDELWVALIPSWGGYGANHWFGSNGMMPYVEMCEGACDPEDTPPPAPVTPPDPCATPGACASNVLFFPGIEGSRLYEGTGCGGSAEEKLWEPLGESLWKILRGAGDEKVQQLFLNDVGESVCSDVYAKADDIIDSVGGSNIYKSFIDEMNGLEADGTINDWKPIAYDWRLSLSELLSQGTERDGKIYYSESTTTPYIEQTLRALAASSKTGKVTLIAHSNGGLVAKALLNQLGGSASKLVDKVVMVGAPQSGAPVGVGALLYGYDQGISSWGIPILHSDVAQKLAENSPMAYHLLPSQNYFDSVASDASHPVASFAGDAYASEISTYGATINNSSELDTFILASTTLNAALVDYKNVTHSALDSWVPEGIEVDQIAGWGADTVAGIDFYTPMLADAITALAPARAYRPIFTEDGDGTVPVPSALMMAQNTGVNRYWVNLFAYNKETHSSRSHKDIFEIPSLEYFIKNIITNSTSTLPAYILTSQPSSTNNKKLTFFLHSPLTLQLENSEGKITGLAADNSITQDIPDSTYGEFGEVKYITVPEGSYQLTMHGQANGTFSLDIQESSGSVVTALSTIANLPTTPNTLASLTVSGGIDTVSALTVDEDGDGANIIIITSKLGETVNYVPLEDPEPVEEPEPEPIVKSSGGGGGRRVVESISVPVVAPTLATTTQIVATSTSTVATATPSISPVVKKKAKTLLFTAPPKKASVIPQTASVFQASQQSALKNLSATVYNGINGFWSALKKFF